MGPRTTLAALLLLGLAACEQAATRSDAEWRARLTPQQFHILREQGTEAPYSGELANFHGRALFVCAGCGKVLFSSDAKFDSGTGWPSFWQPINPGAVQATQDFSLGLERAEVHCPRCGGHLGHVFNDGPPPTGLRYCINSAALKALPQDADPGTSGLVAWLKGLVGR